MKVLAPLNNSVKLVIPLVFQLEIWPYVELAVSLSDNHALTAVKILSVAELDKLVTGKVKTATDNMLPCLMMAIQEGMASLLPTMQGMIESTIANSHVKGMNFNSVLHNNQVVKPDLANAIPLARQIPPTDTYQGNTTGATSHYESSCNYQPSDNTYFATNGTNIINAGTVGQQQYHSNDQIYYNYNGSNSSQAPYGGGGIAFQGNNIQMKQMPIISSNNQWIEQVSNSNNQQSERHGRQINGSTTTGIPMQNSLTTETVRVTTRAQLQQQQQQDDGEEDNNEDDLSNNNNQQRPPPMGGGGSGQPGGNPGPGPPGPPGGNGGGNDNNDDKKPGRGYAHPRMLNNSQFIYAEQTPPPSFDSKLSYVDLRDFMDSMYTFNRHDALGRNIQLMSKIPISIVRILQTTLIVYTTWFVADLRDTAKKNVNSNYDGLTFTVPAIGNGKPIPWDATKYSTLDIVPSDLLQEYKDNATYLSQVEDRFFLSLCAVHLRLGDHLTTPKYSAKDNYFTKVFDVDLTTKSGWNTILLGIPKLIDFVDAYGAYANTANGYEANLIRYPSTYYKQRTRYILEQLLKYQWPELKEKIYSWKELLDKEGQAKSLSFRELCSDALSKLQYVPDQQPKLQSTPANSSGKKKGTSLKNGNKSNGKGGQEKVQYGIDKAQTGEPVLGTMCFTCGFAMETSPTIPQDMKDKVRNKERELCVAVKNGCKCPHEVSTEEKAEGKRHSTEFNKHRKNDKSKNNRSNRPNRQKAKSVAAMTTTTTTSISNSSEHRSDCTPDTIGTAASKSLPGEPTLDIKIVEGRSTISTIIDGITFTGKDLTTLIDTGNSFGWTASPTCIKHMIGEDYEKYTQQSPTPGVGINPWGGATPLPSSFIECDIVH